VVQDLRKELGDAKKKGWKIDEEKIRKTVYGRARADAQRLGTLIYEPVDHRKLVDGEPAELRSQMRITPEQVLAIGLPDLAATALPGAAVDDAALASAAAARQALPPSMRLDVVTVVDHMRVDDRDRKVAHRTLAQVTANLTALGVIDVHGQQVAGQAIGKLHGIDGLFVWYALMNHALEAADCRALCELLVDHDSIQRVLDRKDLDKRRDWIKQRLRELRDANPQASWEDAEAEYDQKFPRELTRVELIHQEFQARLPHPELHGGKRGKAIWASIDDEGLGFLEYVDRHRLAHVEGSLFTYLARVMKVARRIAEGTGAPHFAELAERVRAYLSIIDPRL
jgi:hypothetical protein